MSMEKGKAAKNKNKAPARQKAWWDLYLYKQRCVDGMALQRKWEIKELFF